MAKVWNFFLLNFLLIHVASAAYISDNGCPCSNTANLTINGGCRLRALGFDGVTSGVTWCLTDQVKSPGCGTLSGYGYADTCVNAGFTSAAVLPNQVLLVPGQDQWTFYTGQSINLTWSSTLFENNERVIFSVYTPNNPPLRNILGTGGGGGGITSVSENITRGSLRAGLVISTSTFTPVVTTVGNVGVPSPLQFSILSSGTNNANSEARVMNSTQLITILQHRIINVEAYFNNSLLTPSTNLPLDDRIITVRWSAQGFARRGTATVTFQRCGGGGGCSQGNPQTGSSFGMPVTLTLDASLTSYEVNLTMQRATTNNFQANALYQVSVQVTGNYNYGTVGFVLGVAPTPSPTPTYTPTGTVTPTATGTPSPTKSPVDLLTALLREQAEKQKADAEAAKAAVTGIVGGVVGGVIFAIVLGFVVFKVIQRRQSAERRQRKLAATRRATTERESIYGVTIATIDKPSDKDIANLAAYKAATKAQNNPMTKANSLTSPAVKSNSLNAPAKTVGRGSGRNINRV